MGVRGMQVDPSQQFEAREPRLRAGCYTLAKQDIMTTTGTGILVCFTTIGSRDAGTKLSEMLVAERLAACVQMVPGLRSVYLWKDEVQRDDETLLIIKTTQHRWADLKSRIKEIHPYEVPELVALPVTAGFPAYLEWIGESVDPG